MECHNADYPEAELDFEELISFNAVQQRRRKWTRVLERLRLGEMPPSDAQQPTPEERQSVADWLQAERDGDETAQAELQRLNQWATDAAQRWWGEPRAGSGLRRIWVQGDLGSS